ncbi:putative phosphoesterase, Icc -like protein [Thermoplasmatales archaeon BRNA1]|nr:putative phosphoesterase, Icc -like protein [Thermoplasmatales archaeon BRNA1]
MKFLVLTDLHQKASNLAWINSIIEKENIENVLFLGDVTDMGTSDDAVEIISSVKAKVYCLPGNCDPRDLPARISEVAVDMHGKSVQFGDVYVAGLGGSNVTIFGTPFELSEEEIDAKLRPISRKGMILMTHAPSYGILDHIPNGMSVGSPAIRKIVEDFRPLVALSGHIHEDIGAQTIDGTLFVNPGPAKEGYCAILTVDNGKADAKLIGPLDPA